MEEITNKNVDKELPIKKDPTTNDLYRSLRIIGHLTEKVKIEMEGGKK